MCEGTQTLIIAWVSFYEIQKEFGCYWAGVVLSFDWQV